MGPARLQIICCDDYTGYGVVVKSLTPVPEVPMKTQILDELFALFKNPPSPEMWQRFCRGVEPPTDWTVCWIWRGNRTADNYGRFYWKKYLRTHRQIWIWLTPNSANAESTDHVWCSNRPCWNPLHTVPTTNHANTLRSTNFIAVNARKTHCKRGHELCADNLVAGASKVGLRSCRQCAGIRIREWWLKKKAARTSQYERTTQTAAKY